MSEAGMADNLLRQSWHVSVLRDLQDTLGTRPWCRDMLLRGSMASGLQDSESDVDFVATVADDSYDVALDDLSRRFPLSLPALPPWLDSLVRDFGGLGFVYLVQLDELKWGQVDIYLLPHSRRQLLFDREFVHSLRAHDCSSAGDISMLAGLDAGRQRRTALATQDLQQAALACYVALFLLRKRLIRGDVLQIYGDTYATAQCVRDFAILACYPDRSELAWRALDKVAARSANPGLVAQVISTFAQQNLVDAPGLSGRVSGLQQLVALLAPGVWREHSALLRSIGRYLVTGAAPP